MKLEDFTPATVRRFVMMTWLAADEAIHQPWLYHEFRDAIDAYRDTNRHAQDAQLTPEAIDFLGQQSAAVLWEYIKNGAAK